MVNDSAYVALSNCHARAASGNSIVVLGGSNWVRGLWVIGLSMSVLATMHQLQTFDLVCVEYHKSNHL